MIWGEKTLFSLLHSSFGDFLGDFFFFVYHGSLPNQFLHPHTLALCSGSSQSYSHPEPWAMP